MRYPVRLRGQLVSYPAVRCVRVDNGPHPAGNETCTAIMHEFVVSRRMRAGDLRNRPADA